MLLHQSLGRLPCSTEFSKRSRRVSRLGRQTQRVVSKKYRVGEDFKLRSNSERRFSNRSPRLCQSRFECVPLRVHLDT